MTLLPVVTHATAVAGYVADLVIGVVVGLLVVAGYLVVLRRRSATDEVDAEPDESARAGDP